MRFDLLIATRGLTQSREAAKSAILEGFAFVDGKCVRKPSTDVPEAAEIEIRGESRKFVSRGGYKLEHALDFFEIGVCGHVCLDLGASTGGFTDCLLQRGAALVYAVDVGHGQLDATLSLDDRVVAIEGVNARDLRPELLGDAPSFATVDLSFISLALVLPALRGVMLPEGVAICLVKPQFEAGRGNVGKNGIVRDEKTHIRVLEEFVQNAQISGFAVRGITYSPMRGGGGNLEFLAYLAGDGNVQINIRDVIKSAHADVQ